MLITDNEFKKNSLKMNFDAKAARLISPNRNIYLAGLNVITMYWSTREHYSAMCTALLLRYSLCNARLDALQISAT